MTTLPSIFRILPEDNTRLIYTYHFAQQYLSSGLYQSFEVLSLLVIF